MRYGFLIRAAVAIILLFGLESFAHHGNTDYDTTKTVTVKGMVTVFEFINPHAGIVLDVKNDQGLLEKWSIELASPNSLRRNGWNRNTVKPGTEITATGNPTKNGSKNMLLVKLVLPSGEEFRAGQ